MQKPIASSPFPKNPQSPSITSIVDVWSHNLETEMKHLASLIDQYPYISFVCSGRNIAANLSGITFRIQNFQD